MEEEVVAQDENNKTEETNVENVASEAPSTEENVEENATSETQVEEEVKVEEPKQKEIKKTELTEEESESIEKVLESVSDEFLAKKKRKRTITYSIISSIVFAIAVVIIVLSCIKVDLRPNFIGEALSYRITIDGSEKMTLYADTEEYDKFNDAYLKSFKTQYLTALFTGRLGGYTVVEAVNEAGTAPLSFYSSTTSKTPSSALKSELGDNYVRVLLSEDEEYSILNSDGTPFVSAWNSNKTFTFDEMYFTLSTENSQQDLTLYLAGKIEGTTSVRIIKIDVRANTYNLYKMVTE